MALVVSCMHVLEFYNFNICCIRVISSLLKLLYIVDIYLDEYWLVGPSGRLTHGYVILDYIGLFGTGLYLGRSPRTKETLPDFVNNVGLPDVHEYSAG